MTRKKRMTDKAYKDYMALRIADFAFGLCQFWQAGEVLLDQDAKDDETYFRRAIERLNENQRWDLLVEMFRLTTLEANYFTKPTIESGDARRIVIGVIARFPRLQQLLQYNPKKDMLPDSLKIG